MNFTNFNDKYNNTKGGQVIASGGFGCVFSPALKCKDSKKREKNKISKLMIERHALEEYKEITLLKEQLDNIPNYQEYFLVDKINICKPSKLSKSDLKQFKKCSALPKNNITRKNINKSLNKLLTLNIPNGGLAVDEYIYKNNSFHTLIEINNSLQNLLKNGIVPMNEKNVYHCDIKDSNILVDIVDGNMKTRLIDWGLSTEYIPDKNNKIPNTWRNRPLQFNVPFSVILFSDIFIERYQKYIQSGGTIEKNSLQLFINDYLRLYIKERGEGHYRFINQIMYILFFNEIKDELKNVDQKTKMKIIEREYTLKYIINYLVEILLNFSEFKDNEIINLRIYLDNVFIRIVDIYGFIVTYFPILDLFYSNYTSLTSEQFKCFYLLKEIFIKYLFQPRINPIQMNELIYDLKELSVLLKNVINENLTGVKQKKLKSSKLSKAKGITGRTFIPKIKMNRLKSFTNKTRKTIKTRKI